MDGNLLNKLCYVKVSKSRSMTLGQIPKLKVAGSNPVSRSKEIKGLDDLV